MPIEKDINEAIKKNFPEIDKTKALPEFIDRAKFLEERLKKRESLLVKLDKDKPVDSSGYLIDFLYLEIKGTKGKPERIANLDYSGRISYRPIFFEDYEFSTESQRER